MFSLIDIADMHQKHNHKSLLKKCDFANCKTESAFIMKYGVIPPEQCEFPEGFNEIVSSKGNELSTYIIGSMLWGFVSDYYLNTASTINLMLMLYVLSKHCVSMYDEVELIGYWNRENGEITLMSIEDISQATIETINYNYIGYIKGNETWEKARGTNKSILYEVVAYFKNRPKYIESLSNFRYEENDRKLIATFEKTTNYPIVSEVNSFLAPPVKYGGSEYERVTINYISDIHIGHHIYKGKPIQPQIRKMVRALVESQQRGLVFFGGDTAVDRNLCAIFYKEYMIRRQYVYYKMWREDNRYRPALTKHEAEAEYKKQLSVMIGQRDEEIRRLKPWFKYTRKFEAKNEYEMDLYISSDYFTRKNYPEFVTLRLRKIKKIENDIKDFIENKKSFLEELRKGTGEKSYTKQVIGDVFAVLGNHEMADFYTVGEAVEYYTRLFKTLGIHFLNNDVLSDGYFVIFGGCGFAKYNPEFNATNTLNAKSFTREDEISETECLESAYNKALEKAKAERKPLIVLSHYPTKDWLEHNHCDAQAVYFTGHTHRNTSENTDQRNIYADNQVGYKRKTIVFKIAKLGTVQNPFIDFEDGCYEITTDQYCDFYRYNGDQLSGVSPLNNVLRDGGKFFMIKHLGFYGFFTQNNAKEISICLGGRTKKIPKVKSVRYLMDNFDAMISVYLTAMIPFRKAQEQISAEVQSLGLSGRIHGCIVDVNFYNHIMLNPIDGTITYYYSPWLGTLQSYKTFAELLEHMDESSLIEGKKKDVQDKYALMLAEECLLAKEHFSTCAEIGEMVTIDIKDSIYNLSERINQLQRLFTSRILRVWNDNIIRRQSKESRLIGESSLMGEELL